MPYNDPQRKREWEQRHRGQRVARRRELRRIEAARQAAQPATPEAGISGAAFVLPMIARRPGRSQSSARHGSWRLNNLCGSRL